MYVWMDGWMDILGETARSRIALLSSVHAFPEELLSLVRVELKGCRDAVKILSSISVWVSCYWGEGGGEVPYESGAVVQVLWTAPLPKDQERGT